MNDSQSAKRPLGKGLASLLGPEEDTINENQTYIDADLITISRYQPRRYFDENELNDLATSIREVGILQPLVVRKKDDGSFELIAGERRLRASQLAGLTQVPITIKDFDDQKAFEATLIENIQRSDLNPIEEAKGYQMFIDEFGYVQEDLSRLIGKSRSHIANSLRLLKLPESIQKYVEDGMISAGHARAILASTDPENIAQQIIDRKLNVRQAEALTRKKTFTTARPRGTSHVDEDLASLEQQLSGILKFPVKIQIAGHRGRMEVFFESLEELDSLISRISRLKVEDPAA